MRMGEDGGPGTGDWGLLADRRSESSWSKRLALTDVDGKKQLGTSLLYICGAGTLTVLPVAATKEQPVALYMPARDTAWHYLEYQAKQCGRCSIWERAMIRPF